MLEHNILIENVYFRLFDNVARLDVSSNDVHLVEGKNINTLKVLHTHPFYEIFACESNRFVIMFEGFEQPLEPGDILIIPPVCRHVMLSDENRRSWPSIHFLFEKRSCGEQNLFEDLVSFLDSEDPIISENRKNESAALTELMKSVPDGEMKYLAATLADILIRLTRFPHRKVELPLPEGKKSGSGKKVDIMINKQIEDLIASRYMTDITAAQASEILHLSVRQLDRIMLKNYNMSFHRTVTLRRLTVAAEFFKTTKLSIERISSDVGFESRAGFTKAFQRQFGMTPLKYRKAYCSTGSKMKQ